MPKQEFEVSKGCRDWLGKDAYLRNLASEKLRTVFERYGYEPIETPVIETREAIAFKGGGEIQREVFQLSDQGGRKLALRFDQTVPLARFVASHYRELHFPFKRYVIGPVFRDGPTQPDQGRYRQFTQCDVDVLGIKGMEAEAELLALAKDAFGSLGLGGVEVNINNRKLLDGVLDAAGVPDFAKLRAIVTLDKMDKIGLEGVRDALTKLTFSDTQTELSRQTTLDLNREYREKELEALNILKPKIEQEVGPEGYRDIRQIFEQAQGKPGADPVREAANYKSSGNQELLTPDKVSRLIEIATGEGDSDEVFVRLDKTVTSLVGREGLSEIRTLLDYSKALGFDFVRFNPSLARGLNYYTGTTLEVFLKDRAIVNSAILAGGRFDDMVGEFIGEGKEIPAIGFSFGLERLVMILGNQLSDCPSTPTQLYLIPMGTTAHCLKLAHYLRDKGVNVDMEMTGRKVGNAISYANEKGIPFVGVVGSQEVEAGTISLKELKTKRQRPVSQKEVSELIQKGILGL